MVLASGSGKISQLLLLQLLVGRQTATSFCYLNAVWTAPPRVVQWSSIIIVFYFPQPIPRKPRQAENEDHHHGRLFRTCTWLKHLEGDSHKKQQPTNCVAGPTAGLYHHLLPSFPLLVPSLIQYILWVSWVLLDLKSQNPNLTFFPSSCLLIVLSVQDTYWVSWTV